MRTIDAFASIASRRARRSARRCTTVSIVAGVSFMREKARYVNVDVQTTG